MSKPEMFTMLDKEFAPLEHSMRSEIALSRSLAGSIRWT
jgi:hypothetical protein